MTLPPWVRAVQQSYATHILIAAAIAGGGIAFTCFAKDMALSLACAKSGLIAAGIYLFGILQHSPGSASFKKDGELNVPVEKVIETQAAGLPLKVIAADRIIATEAKR